jgi:spermidine synthase/MFS family permease
MDYSRLRLIFLLLFAISGFAGLIYESIWSHYLKLFLGHAAYAQTLVLAIFMGGMAIGAWLPSRYGIQWKNLLLRYALIEAAIGLCAVVFHKLFVNVTDVTFDSLIPMLVSPQSVNLLKWVLAAILILPQSILLGMTFPLMSASLIRRDPTHPGANLAMLYFTNSFGAAIGVLVSGFVLIEQFGLPGTILTAGLINIFVGLTAWLIARSSPEPSHKRAAKAPTRGDRLVPWRPLIYVSFLTGAASFIYEIGWIRMLNLVLGTSTHAFELMLSAFIVGLAFGGLWIRNRIDRLAHPARFLGWVQIVMGLLALVTLGVYNTSFDIMQRLISSLSPTDGGYFLFNLGSHAIAILIMVPVTFCAGMTLPLITHALIRSGHGEKSIGAVYAANTLGAIVGVFFAVHIGMSALGLKGLIAAGAAIDMALGVVLLGTLTKLGDRRPVLVASLIAVASLVAVLAGVEFDHYKMSSGVYRHGQLLSPMANEILYHKDGKTATVDLIKSSDGGISIATNGKSDAKIAMKDGAPSSGDEPTMIMAGTIPLLLHPQARTAANIGMGSGLTTHILLNSADLERVDTIEIEPAMIEAARGFRPRVENTFSDPRSHFHIDDAKSFFSANRSRYDIIVSEPSNPWVSGVASLFTDEFYRRVRTHLNPGGIFVQWLHVYETDFNLIASVMKAIGRNFPYYHLYAASDGDILIAAIEESKTPVFDKHEVVKKNLVKDLHRIDVNTIRDLELRYIGDRALLEPLFIYAPAPVNSDYFPILDLHAARARFVKSHAVQLAWLRSETLPALEMLDSKRNPAAETRSTSSVHFTPSRRAYTAMAIQDYYANGTLRTGESIEPGLLRHVLLTQRLANDCRGTSTPDFWLDSVYEILRAVTSYLKPSEVNVMWRQFRTSDCYRKLHSVQQEVFALFGAIGRREAAEMAILSERLLKNGQPDRERDKYLLAAGMLGYLTDNKPEKAHDLWKTYAQRVLGSEPPDILLRLLWSHSIHRIQKNRG